MAVPHVTMDVVLQHTHTEKLQTNCEMNCFWNVGLQESSWVVNTVCPFPQDGLSFIVLHSLTLGGGEVSRFTSITSALLVNCHFCFCPSSKNEKSHGTAFCGVCPGHAVRVSPGTPHPSQPESPHLSSYSQEQKYDPTRPTLSTEKPVKYY